MKKCSKLVNLFLMSLIAFCFFSCKQVSNQGASISIMLPKELSDVMARYATSQISPSRQAASSGEIIRIELGGDMNQTLDFVWNSQNKSPICTIDNLPVGITVSVSVSVLIGGNKWYETTSPPNVTLSDGQNTASVLLEKAIIPISYIIDGKPTELNDIGQLNDEHTVAVIGTLDNKSLSNIKDAFQNNVQINLDLSGTTWLTSIDDSTFLGWAGLKSIAIPAGVTSIGNQAFYNCTYLESITIPTGVTSIGNDAFNNCQTLESITIPTSVTSIGKEAFSECTSLKSIAIPAAVMLIDGMAFYGCTKLNTITFENTEGWSYYTTLDQTTIESADVSNPSQNATNLTTRGNSGSYGLTRNP